MKVVKQKPEQVYAHGTPVPVSRTVEEIKGLLHKHGADQYFAHVQRPASAGGSFIAFVIKTPVGEAPVRVIVPSVYLKEKYLERESYRAALLIIKSKFVEVDMGEPVELVFLANMASTARDRLLPKIDLPLLEG